jgi:glyoxylase-like metal-dependent hydrolase (beta-lactamase superfamily II)
MQRRLFLQHSAFLMASLGLSSYKFPFDTPYKIKELRNGVGVFTERGGTIAFASTSKGIAVVDSQFPEQSNHLIEALKGMSENPIKLLFNTHHHGDHSGGNIAFKGIVEHVIAHENSLKNQKAVAEKQNTVEKQLFPDITYQDTHKEKLGKRPSKCIILVQVIPMVILLFILNVPM